MYPSQWFFHYGEEIVITRSHIGRVWRMFAYLPSPAVKEILDSVSSMSPRIVVNDDGVCCQQVMSRPQEKAMTLVGNEPNRPSSLQGLILLAL
jgi:hypothetical protein